MTPRSVGLIIFQADEFAFGSALRKLDRFFPEVLNRSSRIYAFGCIDADQAHPFTRLQHDRIAIDSSFDADKILSTSKGDAASSG